MLPHILEGGVIMFPLLALSILGIGIIIDRYRAFRVAEVDTKSLRRAVTRDMEAGKIDDAIRECEKYKGPVAAVLMVGLLKFRKLVRRGRPMSEIENNVTQTMSDYSPHMVEALEKRLNALTMIASVSPLLGMTGTVVGMITAFGAMAQAGMDASGVAKGISEALVTTASGLRIAVPCVIAYSYFSRKLERFTLEIEEASTEVMDIITLHYVSESESQEDRGDTQG